MSKLSVGQTDVISMNVLNIKNAGGRDVDLMTFQMDLASFIFVFSKRLESNQNISLK